MDTNRLWFTPDGKRVIATAAPEFNVRSWDIATGQLLQGREVFRVRVPCGEMLQVQVSPSGRSLLGLGERKAILWHVP